MLVKENIPLKNYNTFHINAFARNFIEVFSDEELIEALNFLKGEKFFILGGGSNILLMNDVDNIVKISIAGIKQVKEDSEFVYISTGAGVIWNELVNYATERNLGGIENLVLIPGTTGAAPMQNIGAYGQELKDTFYSLKAVDVNSGSINEFDKESCRFGYRTSIFKTLLKNQVIITSVTLRLSKNPEPNISYSSVKSAIDTKGINNYTIKDVSRIIADIRTSKLPDPAVIGNAGSFFKNPEIDFEYFEKLKEKYPTIASFKSSDNKMKIAAGWLIEQCGWKGKREGDAGAHKSQALVLVNYGNASGKDILDFASKIKDSVKAEFGITLEEEVNIIK